MKHHSSYLYGKLCESFSSINVMVFVEQKRNTVDFISFLSTELDRLLPGWAMTCRIYRTKTNRGESSRNDCCKSDA